MPVGNSLPLSSSGPRSGRGGRRGGWTLRESIVVLVLILCGLAFLFPYLLAERTTSRRLLCERRLIAWGQAMQRFEELGERYPAFREERAGGDGPSRTFGWPLAALPFWSEASSAGTPYEGPQPQAIFDELLDGRGRSPENYYLPLTVCPADTRLDRPERLAWTTFVANCGMPDVAPSQEGPADWPANGILLDGLSPNVFPVVAPDREFIEERDGLDFTLLLTENLDAGLWVGSQEAALGFVWIPHLIDGQPDPGDQLLQINQGIGESQGAFRTARPSSWHPGGVNVVFGSGRTQFLSQKIDYLAFANLVNSSRNEGRLPGSQQAVPPPYRDAP